MPRTYTKKTILDGGQTKDEDFNSEIQGSLSEFNGQLDANQLPLQSVTADHLKQPTISTSYLTKNGTYSMYMTTQSYHQTEYIPNETAITMRWDDPLYVGSGWIRLQDLLLEKRGASGCYGAELIFDALEGMLAGNAVIDFTWYPGGAAYRTEGLNAYALYGRDTTIEWGVFIDDVLVAKSGWIWPRRLTLNLPFNTPVSSKPIKIDIRFRLQFLDPAAKESESSVVIVEIEEYQSLKYNGGVLWCRNQIR
jgi:hypothetical protein